MLAFSIVALVFFLFYKRARELNSALQRLIIEDSWLFPVIYVGYSFLAWLFPVIAQILSINFSFKEKMKAVKLNA